MQPYYCEWPLLDFGGLAPQSVPFDSYPLCLSSLSLALSHFSILSLSERFRPAGVSFHGRGVGSGSDLFWIVLEAMICTARALQKLIWKECRTSKCRSASYATNMNVLFTRSPRLRNGRAPSIGSVQKSECSLL